MNNVNGRFLNYANGRFLNSKLPLNKCRSCDWVERESDGTIICCHPEPFASFTDNEYLCTKPWCESYEQMYDQIR